jgi:hypothetical protein
MELPAARRNWPRIWVLGAVAVLFSIASAYSFFIYVTQAFVAGDLLGLPGRESDVAIAQHRATCWLMASLFSLVCSIVPTTLLLPFFAHASRLARFVGRFVLASVISLVLTVLIGNVAFSVITALYRH